MAVPFDALTPRQRECLRLVYRLRSSKQIAAELGLEKSTVDSYIAESKQLLGARDRRDAAQMFADHEGQAIPHKIGSDFTRVSPVADPVEAVTVPGRPSDWRSILPFRRRGERHNEIGPIARLGWIAGLAIVMMIAFGMLANGLSVLGSIIQAFSPARS